MKTRNQRRVLHRILVSQPVEALLLAVALVFAIMPAASQLQAQDLPFDSTSDGSDGPLEYPSNLTHLYGLSIAYDAARGETIAFGGYNNSVGYTNETYSFDGYEWTKLNPTTKPDTRAYHQLVWDSEREEIVMFGGFNGTNFAETWTWDGTDWTLESPTTSPPARYQFGMAFDDVNNEVVLYGGVIPGDSYAEDTWTWDGTNWTEQSPTNSPSGRRYHSMAFDSTAGNTVLYGGYRNGSWNSETWTWNGTDWTMASPTTNPGPRTNLGMSDDPNNGGILLFGGYYSGHLADTWSWDGSDWTLITPTTMPTSRDYLAMCYDGTLNSVVLAGGSLSTGVGSNTFEFTGGDWSQLTGDILYFDMNEKPDGIWNFTTINIPADVELRFIKNAANTPVFWLATGDVTIEGTLNLNGATPINNQDPGNEGVGGPGGFDGGLGGVRFDVSGTYAGAPGEGPGGGNPGVTINQNGTNGAFNGVYGNASLNPLYGGSGGGGGASDTNGNGGNGGGGGGAILIASSLDMTIDGLISARGGDNPWGGASYGGAGSGGAIRLVADRVSGSGRLDVRNGDSSQSSPWIGFIRIEAYYRTLIDDAQYIYPAPSAGAPSNEIGAILPQNVPALFIAEVAGDIVAQPPGGSSVDPDVVFQESGSITVVVQASNIPDGTPITLRITTNGQVINLPGPGNPVVQLSGGEATFNVFVPAGLGTIQAFAEFTPE